MAFSFLFLHFLVILSSSLQFGVSLAGLDFGESNLPGVYNTHYTSPLAEELDYYSSKGIDFIRLPIRWERIQGTAFGPFRTADIGYVDNFLSLVAARNMKVVIDLHNYGRHHGNVIGSSALSHEAFLDILEKLVERYNSHTEIYGWALMNEPRDMATDLYPDGKDNWKQACQKAITAIRALDTTRPIIVPGLTWSNAIGWESKSGFLADLTDPNDNLIYEAHSYFDNDNSGTYNDGTCSGVTPSLAGRAESVLQEWITWLRTNGKKGLLGEINTSRDTCWLTVLDKALEYLVTAKDVVEVVVFWAGGPWWGEYPLTMNPDGSGNDRPQMDVVQNYVSETGDDCEENYFGDNCEFTYCNSVGSNLPTVCSGEDQGTCTSYNNCVCKTGYTGTNCELSNGDDNDNDNDDDDNNGSSNSALGTVGKTALGVAIPLTFLAGLTLGVVLTCIFGFVVLIPKLLKKGGEDSYQMNETKQ